MPKILSNLDLGKNELQNVVIQKLNSAPSNPIEGQIYYNTLSKNLYRYNGTNWVTYQADLNISGTTSVNTLSIDSTPTANSTNLVTSGGVYAAIQGGGGTGDMLAADYDPDGDVAEAGGIPDYVAANAPPYFLTCGQSVVWSDVVAAYNAGRDIICKSSRGSEGFTLYGYAPLCEINLDSTYGSISFSLPLDVSGNYGESYFYSVQEGNWTSTSYTIPPADHASSLTTYGKGSAQVYGHVKLSSSTSSVSGVAEGIAATPSAVKSAYDLANGKQDPLTAGTDYIVPPSSASNGQVLTYNNNTWSAQAVPEEIFVATYNSTSFSDVVAAYTAGKIVVCKYNYFYYILHYYDTAQAIFSATSSTNVKTIAVSSSNSWSASTTTFVPSTRTINGKALSSNITLNASDVGAGVGIDYITTSITWTGSSSPYTQTVTLSNYTVTANTKVDVQADATALAALATAGTTQLFISNNSGTLTLYAIGNKPTSALNLQVTCMEVS